MSSIGSHVLHRRALDAVSAGLVVLLDADRRIADWNTAAGAVLGLRRDAVGHDHGTLFGESLDSAFAAALANGHTVAEATMVDAEGRRSRRRFRVVALHDEGRCVGYAIHGEPPPVDDEVVQLRREARSCRALLREIVDDVWCSDASGRTTRLLETRTAPAVDAPHDTGKSLALLHPDDRAAVVAATQQALREGRSFTVSARGLRTDGSYRHLEIRGVPVRDADGKIQDWIGATVDVHEARLTEERDRESQQRLRIAVDAAPMSAWSLDPETWLLEIIARGPGWGPGVGPGPVSFTAALDAVHPDEQEANKRAFERALTTGEPLGVTCRLLCADGVTRWTSSHGRVVPGPDGKPRLFGVTIDVSERMRAQQALQQSEARFANVIDKLPLAVCITERDSGIFVDANPVFLSLLGKERGEVIGRSSLDLELWDDPAKRARMLANTAKGRHTDECSMQGPDGGERHLLHTAEAIESNGRPCILSMIHDITAHRRSEEALLRMQKMEAIGRLAGGVAHDFNNLLSVLSSTCFLLPQELARGKPVDETIHVLQNVLERGSGLTRQLLAMSRQQVTKPEILDCSANIRRNGKLLQHLLGEDIELRLETSTGLPPIRIDQSQFDQVVLNLVANARDAMPAGGRLTIRTDVVDVPSSDPRVGKELATGAHVRITVEDNGLGMDETTRVHAFEPFFTKKLPGDGTGLGLAVVHGIVRQGHGTITIASEVNLGTVVTILLPVAHGEIPVDPSPEAGTPRNGTETVLVVEDDDGVRQLVRSTLEILGYKVLEARSGAEAVEQATAPHPHIDLLLTDAIMPGMGGRQVADALRAMRPDLEVIFMSGYTDDRLLHQGVLGGHDAYLQKPFSIVTLADTIRRVLDGPDACPAELPTL